LKKERTNLGGDPPERVHEHFRGKSSAHEENREKGASVERETGITNKGKGKSVTYSSKKKNPHPKHTPKQKEKAKKQRQKKKPPPRKKGSSNQRLEG